MKKLFFVLIFVFAITCGHALADDLGGPTITGKLYWVAKDGKEMPPTQPSRVNIGYWDNDGLKATIMGKDENGRMTMVTAQGTARLNTDGTFSVTVNLREIPAGIVFVGLQYRDAANRDSTIRRENGDSIKIDISKGLSEIKLGKIRIE